MRTLSIKDSGDLGRYLKAVVTKSNERENVDSKTDLSMRLRLERVETIFFAFWIIKMPSALVKYASAAIQSVAKFNPGPLARDVFCAVALVATSACTLTPGPVVPVQSGASRSAEQTLLTAALIMGEPNFSIDGAYQELEEGYYSKPDMRGRVVFAPVAEMVEFLGGRVERRADGASYLLADQTLSVTVGNPVARLNGAAVTLEAAPTQVGAASSVWVPVASVFTHLGAFVKWDETRQRLSAAFTLPKSRKLESLTTGGTVMEFNLLDQPAAFYASTEGVKLAEVLLAYQNADGGWPKVDTRTNLLVPVNTAALTGFRTKSTIDNDSTTKQITALARVYAVNRDARVGAAALRGVNYLLSAQLANGGWQQFWPEPQGYKARITFNDDAIANSLEVLRDAARREGGYSFVDQATAAKAQAAYDRGLALILRAQLVVGGKKTGWCAQYDENTLQPVMGRAFELPSISGHESVNVVRFLMGIDNPPPAVVQAVQDAVVWFQAARFTGIRLERKDDRTLEFGFDRRVVADARAKPLWARFYDLETGQALFSARDSVKRTGYADVSYERRVKYNWYTEAPNDLLDKDYPVWQRKWAAGQNVLNRP